MIGVVISTIFVSHGSQKKHKGKKVIDFQNHWWPS